MGTKGGGRGANQGSPKMTISPLMLTEPLESIFGLPRTTIQRHATVGNLVGGSGRVKTPGIIFDSTTSKENADEADTTRNVVIYDENFMTFLNSVTIAHNS